MEHPATWLDIVPGFMDLQENIASRLPASLVEGAPIVLQHVIGAILVFIIMLTIGLHYRLSYSDKERILPAPNPSFMGAIEVLLEMVYKQCRELLGPANAAKHFPVIAALGMFVLFSNLLGLLPGFIPPTENWNTTVAAAIFVFIYYNFWAFRVQGLHYIAHTVNPAGTWWGWFMAPFFLVIEMVSHIARPFSLSVRLMANMMGDHKIVGVFVGLCAPLVPIPIVLLGMMTSFIQATVFTLLSLVYVQMAVNNES